MNQNTQITQQMTHVVTVWEKFENSWIPYSPTISSNLERAYNKKLTRVNLTDCETDPDESSGRVFFVNMRTMKQCSEDLQYSVNVRRKFYKCDSPAGKGLKWEWKDGDTWKTYNMEVQQVIENAWTTGAERVELSKTYLKLPFSINFLNLTQVSENGKISKPVRRIQQAPYPKLSVKAESVINNADLLDYRQNILPQKPSFFTSKNNTVNTVQNSNNNNTTGKRAKSVKKNNQETSIARQILNLVTKTSAVKFGHKDEQQQHVPVEHKPRSRVRQLNSDTSSVKSNRRPSVDTVSTYLSHESHGSHRSSRSVQDLIFDDDVFAINEPQTPAGQIVGIDQASNYLARFVRVIDSTEIITGPCPYCLEELRLNSQYPTVCLVRCNHYMHLNCLNELIINTQNDKQTNLFIQCPICLAIYGKKIGSQPNGSMTWFKDSSGYLQIVYK